MKRDVKEDSAERVRMSQGDEKRLGAGAPVWLMDFPRFSSPC
jgi:hypothetical protein